MLNRDRILLIPPLYWTNRRAYSYGYKAAFDVARINPYPMGTAKHSAWRAGMEAGRKRGAHRSNGHAR